jgi:thiol-disulfide isomerase/thioredoxin
MNTKIKHYLKEIVMFFVIMTILANVISFYKSGDLNKQPLSLKEVKLLDNEKYIFPQNKPILIHFWATWCPTCKLEASNIANISQDYETLTIAVKSGTDDDIKIFLKERDLNYKVVNDNFGFFANNFTIAAYPTTFIYDKDRKLIFSEVGYTSTWGLFFRMWWASL